METRTMRLKTLKDGTEIWLEPTKMGISKELWKKGEREIAFNWILKKESEGCAVGYDVGANIGMNTIYLAQRCKRVVSFEPDKRSRRMLNKNVAYHNFKNVLVCKEAVSDHCMESTIYLSKKPNLTTMCKGQSGKKKCVQCATLDTHAHFAETPTFIKMDLEGFEIKALGGSMKILEGEGVKVLIEVHPQYYNRENDFASTLDDLVEMGYKFKYVISAKGGSETVEKEGYKPVRISEGYSRKIYKDINPAYAIPWATEMPKNKKKILRAILLCK